MKKTFCGDGPREGARERGKKRRAGRLLCLLALAAVCLSSCGGADKGSDGGVKGGAGSGAESPADVEKEGSDGAAGAEGSVLAKPSAAGDALPTETPAPSPSPSPGVKVARLAPDSPYSDAYRDVKFLGLKEYKKIDGEKYKDRAGKGKKYLVLFLSIRNAGSRDDYINYNYISAKVDGRKIGHTFLLNDPKGYPTIFAHVPAGAGVGGFVVWKVPEDWKRLDFRYDGWRDSDGVSVRASFTPKDLKDPKIYSAGDFR